jgi:hypothetical protein
MNSAHPPHRALEASGQDLPVESRGQFEATQSRSIAASAHCCREGRGAAAGSQFRHCNVLRTRSTGEYPQPAMR